MNFLDQQYDEEGKPLGPEKYKEIVRDRYYIAKYGNISYQDTGNMTHIERDYVKSFIEEDLKRQKEYIDKNLTPKTQNNSKGGKIKRS